MEKILIITGSNNIYGSGHARRSKQLANWLTKEGYGVIIENYFKNPWGDTYKTIIDTEYDYFLLDLPHYDQKILNAYISQNLIIYRKMDYNVFF